ncbi:MAG: hypothetical protein ACJAS9_000011 [Polaribacter sp.]|jgi:hypothetical protein
MSNHQLLDNITHKNLKIITKQGKTFGDNASYTQIVLSEFRNLQNHYPIFFRKNTENGQFEVIALFGFNNEENLFLDENNWNASYIPLTIQRRPFLIGFKDVNQQGIISQEPVVHVDMDSPRIDSLESKGKVEHAIDSQPVFLEQGGQTEFLQNKSVILNEIHEGHKHTKLFIDTLLEKDLIEPVTVKVELNDGTKNELKNLYTINEEKINNLSNDDLVSFHQQGYLQHIYMTFASTSNLSNLIDMKNQQLKKD